MKFNGLQREVTYRDSCRYSVNPLNGTPEQIAAEAALIRKPFKKQSRQQCPECGAFYRQLSNHVGGTRCTVYRVALEAASRGLVPAACGNLREIPGTDQLTEYLPTIVYKNQPQSVQPRREPWLPAWVFALHLEYADPSIPPLPPDTVRAMNAAWMLARDISSITPLLDEHR